ncbi:MAG: diaminopimelate epimerase, partial [Planctomycetota bacterium]
KFVKMQGCGNDYIYVDAFETQVADPAAVAVRVADRRFGVGADGLILIQPSPRADAFMDIYNADGSRAEMCGNGIRCVAKFLFDRGLVRRTAIKIDTLSGVKDVALEIEAGRVVGATVNMGVPRFEREPGRVMAESLRIADRTFVIHALTLGNPHCVTFVDGVAAFPVERYGPLIERHASFPGGTNVAFVEVVSPHGIRQRTWERGSGETLACGTGATAGAVMAIAAGHVQSPVQVELRGGALTIAWNGGGEPAFMSGPAVTVCEGEWFESAPPSP